MHQDVFKKILERNCFITLYDVIIMKAINRYNIIIFIVLKLNAHSTRNIQNVHDTHYL
jgi:hypothetical protein